MSTPHALKTFADWVATIRGDEDSESQTFIHRLLQAWGWADALEAGMVFQRKIPGGSLRGGMGRADAVVEGKVLIEMKSRGVALQPCFPQLDRYWHKMAPKPKYAILCNFDEFWIYDFNVQVDEPMDMLGVEDLPRRYSALAFLGKVEKEPQFSVNKTAITERQAARMGGLFALLADRGDKTDDFTPLDAQRFVLQCVLAMFAEDRELLPGNMFNRAVQECVDGKSTYDLLGSLFHEMNAKGVTPAGRFKGTPYFNGGLFSHVPRIHLEKEEVEILANSANDDWRQVRPSIFGNIFEASKDDEARHAHGQHFTSEQDILKIVRPTIIEPWQERIVSAHSIADLDGLRNELTQYRVCDPACGSGNFLFMAYNAMKDLEVLILNRIDELRRSQARRDQVALGLVTPLQLYGIDNDPFAVELARVTLMIARKVANDRLGLTERDLPLDNLDNNIRMADALFTPWPEADAYVGNPPFLGGKHMRLNLGDAYVEQVFQRFPEVRDSVDFCTYWFRLAQDNLKPDGRAGLVATNSIRHGKSRRASLDYIRDNGGHIHSAISTQPWSGEANVHVSLVNWNLEAAGSYRLDGVEVSIINTSLRSSVDVSEAETLEANQGYCFQGVIPVGMGFNVEPDIAAAWIAADPRNAEVVKPFSMGSNLAKKPMGHPDRWIIDFNDRTMEAAEIFHEPFQQVKDLVRPQRMKNRRETTRVNWWRYGEKRPAMRAAIEPLDSYFAVPRVSKWAVFIPFAKNWLPGEKNVVLACDDFYILGLLTSGAHRQWMHAQKGTLKGDIAYTHDSCFETFPFPQQVTAEKAEAIRQQMIELSDYRDLDPGT